jgi:glycerol-3-phosphate dehydrogenase (NAD(P)+)
MKLAVLGAGAWGTALAVHAALRGGETNDVLLWTRRADHAAQLVATRSNAQYLPRVPLPESLGVTSDMPAALAHGRQGLTMLAAPVSALRELLKAMDATSPVVWLAKGFERDSGALPHEVAQDLRPAAPCAVLTGPSFADEVARGQPTALVAASRDAALAESLVAALHGEALRVYRNDDVVGAEVGAAVKNVLAIATGLCDGLSAHDDRGPGLNARAALVTRGLAEMTRLGVALGARAETFMGLSGLGDLVLTATGHLSRNRRVGLRLAEGLALPQVLDELGHVAEGVHCAATVVQRARALGVEMPLCAAVVEVLEGRATPAQALAGLMARGPRAEWSRGAGDRHEPLVRGESQRPPA